MNVTKRIQSAGMATLLTVMLSVIAGGSQSAQAAEISTGEIVESATSTNCLDYQVVGICIWLTCTPYGCETDTSIKVKHYIPELVVSSYQRTGENPWSDVEDMSPANSAAQGGGSMTEVNADAHHSGVRFKNVDAIGHPAVALFSAGLGYTCESPTYPLNPHLLSTFDAVSWRENLVEALYPESLTPGMREVGQLGDLWGNVYPRTGFVAGQQNDYRVAAVAAQRVADIVTRSGQPHIYQPLAPSQRDGYWPPDPVKEGDESTHKWQPLSPQMVMGCKTFPDRHAGANYGDRIDETGDFVWALWRPYSCCERRGEKLIFHSGG